MSTLGATTTPTAGWDFPGTGGWAAASSFTTPAGGGILIQTGHGYFDANTGSPTGYVCVWDSGGTLLGSASVGALPDGSQSAGGQAWHSANFATPFFVGPSTAIWIGFYSTDSLLFSSESGGSSDVKSMGSGGPGSLSGASSSGIGTVGAYVDYILAGAYVNTGTPASPVWTATSLAVNTGTPGSPVETTASGVFVNTGTPASPVWTPGG